jgi:hypothetical protein
VAVGLRGLLGDEKDVAGVPPDIGGLDVGEAGGCEGGPERRGLSIVTVGAFPIQVITGMRRK